jgi:chemotaxis regulatin CheY-phosphate phosphatase CheZ
MNKLPIGVLSVIRKWTLGFIAASCIAGCATTQPYDIGQAPNQDSISDFIQRWDKLDRTHATKDEYRELYAQTLKALSRSMEEAERCRARLEAQ